MSSQWRFLIAALLLGGTALLLRARNSAEVIPPRQPLQSFPHTLQRWTSTDIPLDKEVLDILGPGDFLLRYYRDQSSNFDVDLFIAYFPSQRSGDTIHRSDGSLIRITSRMAPNESIDSAQQRLLSFAGIIVPLIQGYVPR